MNQKKPRRVQRWGEGRKNITLAFMTAALGLSVLGGCTKGNGEGEASSSAPSSSSPTAAQHTDGGGEAANLIPTDLADSSDLPDWTGKQLKLKVWFDQGTGGLLAGARKYKDDLVTNEIARVTGVRMDLDRSFDNGGSMTGSVKMGMLAATNDWPDLIVNGNELQSLVENDKLYDLTELLPKYAPNLMKKIPQSLDTVWNKPYVSMNGKVYAVPANIYENALPLLKPDLDASLFPTTHYMGYLYVRDDILKKLYPQAKTVSEIEDLYMKNGKFTRDELLDVPINTQEDFFKFLYDIQKLGIKEGNQEVSPFFTYSGQDNWNLMTVLYSALLGGSSASGDNSYFTYWDQKTKRLEWGFKQPEFKELTKKDERAAARRRGVQGGDGRSVQRVPAEAEQRPVCRFLRLSDSRQQRARPGRQAVPLSQSISGHSLQERPVRVPDGLSRLGLAHRHL
ncbi:type 2 periplasmic-binding domain-containing protein [Cohnella rhizosphaerae]|uniref:Extracellular solute-binding protein n=1 Tax=Cohnella rhizosphaerae TaxID=1457232 RepID=A0A9X4QRJ3_9BACL|nr:hypothetical protein [Cohnella rhizosphaerae]MDG0808630.1 hypothetical protein [Cohnella rhizosphaerae]